MVQFAAESDDFSWKRPMNRDSVIFSEGDGAPLRDLHLVDYRSSAAVIKGRFLLWITIETFMLKPKLVYVHRIEID